MIECNYKINIGRTTSSVLRYLFFTLFVVIYSHTLSGCSSILPKAPIQPTLYALDVSEGATSISQSVLKPSLVSGLTMSVSTPIASAGYGGIHIIYQRQAHELEHFALNQWVDTPAQMLMPLIVHALEKSGGFRAVVRGSSAAASELRLDTELLRLQHEFTSTPSQARITLRAVIVDTKLRRVVAAREFDVTAPAPSDDPLGGVKAANQAVSRLLVQLSAFCTEVITR
jgi:cholesterol transport system auxiliary component